jgi:hypothetical protein
MTPRRALALLLFASAWLAPHAASAEARIAGAPNAMRLEARDASVEEVLRALAARFNLHYQSKVPLERLVSGTFSGSLSRVVSRVLAGYDHVVKIGPDGLEVMILGVSPKIQTPGEQSSRPRQSPGAVARAWPAGEFSRPS